MRTMRRMIMSTAIAMSAAIVGTNPPVSARHQHEGRATPASRAHPAPEPVDARVASRQQAATLAEQAQARLEAARQSNSAPEMRAAIDDLQTMLAQMRTQLKTCDPVVTAAEAVMPPESPTPAPAAPMAGMDHSKMNMATGASPSPKVGGATSSSAPQTAEADRIKAWLQGYDAAFVAKDLGKLATFYHPDVTIYEGGGINRGWIDYRDRHLGPELKSFENLQFSHSNVVVQLLGPGAAYVTSEYAIKAKMPTRDVDSGGLETLVLVRQDGAWRIRHSHTSSRRRAS